VQRRAEILEEVYGKFPIPDPDPESAEDQTGKALASGPGNAFLLETFRSSMPVLSSVGPATFRPPAAPGVLELLWQSGGCGVVVDAAKRGVPVSPTTLSAVRNDA
jgi:hypothetical protein